MQCCTPNCQQKTIGDTMSLYDKVAQFDADADVAHNIIHGDATTTVTTEGGPVRSLAKLIADSAGYIADIAGFKFEAETYTQLRAYTGVLRTANILAEGIAGTFVRSTTDTTSADNGGTVIVDASNRRWIRVHDGVTINVKWFGAKGDGTTDDKAAFDAAAAAIGSLTVFASFPPYVPSNQTIEYSSRKLLVPSGRYKISGSLTNSVSLWAPQGCIIDCGGVALFDKSASNSNAGYRYTFENVSFVNFSYVWKNWSATTNSGIQHYINFVRCTFQSGGTVFAQNRTPNTYVLFQNCITEKCCLFKGFGDHIRVNTIYGSGPSVADDWIIMGGTVDGTPADRGGMLTIQGVMLSPDYENAAPDYATPSTIKAWVTVERASNVVINDYRFGGEAGGGNPLLKWAVDSANWPDWGVLKIGAGVHVSTGVSPVLFYSMPHRVDIDVSASLGSFAQFNSAPIYIDPSILDDFGKFLIGAQLDGDDSDRDIRRSYRFGRHSGALTGMVERLHMQQFDGATLSEAMGKVYTVGVTRKGAATNSSRATESAKFLNVPSLKMSPTDPALAASETRYTTMDAFDGEGYYTVSFAYRTINGGAATATLENYNSSTGARYRCRFGQLPDTQGQWNIIRVPAYLFTDANVQQNLELAWAAEANKSQTVEFSNLWAQRGYGSDFFPPTQSGFQAIAHMTYMGTAAPTSGQWYAGTRIYNKAPTAGGTPGWMCVTSGAPGTWKAMGNLAA
jgi:hypothetical protein